MSSAESFLPRPVKGAGASLSLNVMLIDRRHSFADGQVCRQKVPPQGQGMFESFPGYRRPTGGARRCPPKAVRGAAAYLAAPHGLGVCLASQKVRRDNHPAAQHRAAPKASGED